MAFNSRTTKESIETYILSTYSKLMSNYQDGFTQWEMKKDLYELKFLLDNILNNSPKFSLEEEWLEDQHKKKVWGILKK
jgi:hypothetical protein